MTVAMQPLALVLGGASSIVIARALGPTGRGVVAAATVAPAFVAAFLAVGFGIGATYFLSKGDLEPRVALGTAAIVSVAASAVGVATYLLGATYLRSTLLHGIPEPFVVVGAAIIPASLFSRNLLSVAQGLRCVALWNVSNLLGGSSVLLLYAALLVAGRFGALQALVAIVVSTVIPAAIVGLWLLRIYPNWIFRRQAAVRAIRFGLVGEAGTLLQLVVYRLDVLIVTALLGFGALGLYAVAFTLSELLWQVPNAAALVLFPRVASERGDTAALTARLVRLTSALLLVEAAAGAFMAPILIPWVFSERFVAAVPAFWILLPGGVVLGAAKLISAHLTGRGRPQQPALATAVAFILTVVLDLALIPRMGINGAAVASTIAYTASATVLWAAFVRDTGSPWQAMLIVRRDDWRFAIAETRQQLRSLVGTPRLPPG